MSATDWNALRAAMEYPPSSPASAQRVLAAFGIEGTVTDVQRVDHRRPVADIGEHVPSSRNTDTFALGMGDGSTLILGVDIDVAGGADADVGATVTVYSGERVIDSDTVPL